MGEIVQTPTATPTPSKGSAGKETQLINQAITADGIAAASGGIEAGNLIEVDVDQELLAFEGDDTPLMGLMLAAKKVPVKSPIVQHYMIDEEVSKVTINAKVTASTQNQVILPLDQNDQKVVKLYSTIHLRGVDGYSEDGSTKTPGEDLMLYVTGLDTASGNPIVRCVNGPRTNKTDDYCTIPEIPAGTICDVLGNALHETQKVVPPDSFMPTPEDVYLQKRAFTQIISDYFESQKKRVPFTEAVKAERAIRKFKREGNRTLWIGRRGKLPVLDPKTGVQMVYFTQGVRWSIKREVMHSGRWTYEEFVALTKMFFTGEDVPASAICLCGKNFLENIQCIDFSKHPEVKITVETNKLGWKVTNIHTVFGDFEFKHEPTLDKIGYTNSAAIFGAGRIVHYLRTTEHSDSEKVEEHEAKRESTIAWDALALKGSCHIFVNCEGKEKAANATGFVLWDSASAPTGSKLVDGRVYYLLQDCAGINADASAGETWIYKTATGWEEYKGSVGV
nr:MAG TPA: hypothetical protein [Caudoviricetes sp.]